MSKKIKIVLIGFVVLLVLSILGSFVPESEVTETSNANKTTIEQQAKPELSELSHNKLLSVSNENYKQVIGNTYSMTLFLEQQPNQSLSEAEFMSQPDANSLDTILVRCKLSESDLNKLDGEAAQSGNYKPYELNVTFREYDESVGLYYTNADCSLTE